MRRTVLVCLILAVVPVLAVAKATHRAAPTKITVSPPIGSPSTRFVFKFRAPQRTGVLGVRERRYRLQASAAAGSGCASGAVAQVPPTRKGKMVSVTLSAGKPWCVGTYRGLLRETDGPACPTRRLCPEFRTRVRTVARFAFEVIPPPPGGTTTGTTPTDPAPPTFAGLESAFACTPGAQRPGQTTPFTLTWQPASDDVTPAAAIVYDVFESITSGGENYAAPTWTTPPGVTSFRTPGLPSHGTFYFVVRARDQAGNEDQNVAEHRGSDPCY